MLPTNDEHHTRPRDLALHAHSSSESLREQRAHASVPEKALEGGDSSNIQSIDEKSDSGESDDDDCSHNEENPERYWTKDSRPKSESSQDAYESALALGKKGNTEFQKKNFGKAIELYKQAYGIFTGLMRSHRKDSALFSAQKDLVFAACSFTLLLNLGAAFLDDQGHDQKSAFGRYSNALCCTEIARDMVRECQALHREGNCTPTNMDWARLYKVSAAAHQRLGCREKTLADARKVLEYNPSDENCRKYVAIREGRMSNTESIKKEDAVDTESDCEGLASRLDKIDLGDWLLVEKSDL